MKTFEHLNIKHLKANIDKTKNMEEKISKHENLNLKKESSILRNDVLSLRTLLKRCNGGMFTFAPFSSIKLTAKKKENNN